MASIVMARLSGWSSRKWRALPQKQVTKMTTMVKVMASNFRLSGCRRKEPPCDFLLNLRAFIDKYFLHKYKMRLSERVDYSTHRAFMIDHVTREDFPEEYKDVVSEVCDLSTDQGKRHTTRRAVFLKCTSVKSIMSHSIHILYRWMKLRRRGWS